ncbi:MAG: SIS domain-containing protein, partial [Candidatus Saccharimonadales bacterium]
AKLAVLTLLVFALTGDIKQGEKRILKSAKQIEQMLKDKIVLNDLQQLAQILAKQDFIYTIGRGISYATALEAALKIKEVTYIHTQGLAGGELKHGPIALISKGTPVIVFAPKDETYDATLANATEIKARGGVIIGVAQKPNAIFDYFIPVAEQGGVAAINQIVPIQLLAYFIALSKGYDRDMPRNMAKCVTVK